MKEKTNIVTDRRNFLIRSAAAAGPERHCVIPDQPGRTL
jgi:hypothetical protein